MTDDLSLTEVFAQARQAALALQLAMSTAFAVALAGLATKLQRPMTRALALLWVIRLATIVETAVFWWLGRDAARYVLIASPLLGALLVLQVPVGWQVARAAGPHTEAPRLRTKALVWAAALGVLIGGLGGWGNREWTPVSGSISALWTRVLEIGVVLLIAGPIWHRIRTHPETRARLGPLGIGTAILLLAALADGWFRASSLSGRLALDDIAMTTVVILLSTLAFGITSLLAALEEERDAIRRASEVLHLANVRALESQRLESLGRLASGVAHDFNNVLGMIIGSADVASSSLSPGASTESARTELQEISAAARRGAGLTRQLLSYARRQPVAPRRIAPAAAVSEILPMLQRLIGASVTIRTTIERHAMVEIDPTQFEQAVVNLTVNARDAMPEGGVLSIAVRQAELHAPRAIAGGELRAGAYVVVEFRDSGSGISPEIIGRIFDPFFTTKGEASGTGLGLATVQSVARLAQGDVTVSSAPGEGATFQIWLPAITD